MRLLARLAPRLSASSLASSSSRRLVHATPSLDPSQHIPEPTLANVAATSQQERIVTAVARQDVELAEAVAAAASSENFVHVKMQYLHPSTKDAVKIPRPADVKVKRVRAEPHYVPLSAHVFGIEPRRDILHSAVVYYLDSLRVGGANTKTRGEVAYSTRKMYQQKGTGRARRGSRGSPLLRKGGVAHGPVPRDFSTKLNRRVRELALRSALSLRWRSGDLVIVKNLHWDAAPGSTSPLAKLLKTKGWDDALFLTAPRNPQAPPRLGLTGKTSAADPIYTPEQVDEHTREFVDFSKAVNNIPRTRLVVLNDLTRQARESARNKEDLKKPGELHAYEVLQRKKLICDLGAIEWLEVQQGGALFHTAIEYQMLSLHELMAEIDGVGAQGASELDSVAEVEEVEDASEAEATEDEAELQAEEDRAIEAETTRVLQGVPDQSGEAPSSKKQQ